MKIDYVILADGAQAIGGKLYVLGGGWSIFHAQSYPAPLNLAIGVGVSYDAFEFGTTHPWNVAIADETGVPIVPEMGGQLPVPQPLAQMPKGVTNRLPFVLQIGLVVPRPGKYSITVGCGSSTVRTDFDALFVRALAPGATPADLPDPTPDEPRN